MQVMDIESVRSLELAGGVTHKVKKGTLSVRGVMFLGEATPCFVFVDADAGVELTVPRHTVVAVDGDLVAPPAPPPPPVDPLSYDVGGFRMEFKSPTELDSELRDRLRGALREVIDDPTSHGTAERPRIAREVVGALWANKPIDRKAAQMEARQRAAAAGIVTGGYPLPAADLEFERVKSRVDGAIGNRHFQLHLLELLEVAEKVTA
jgi:hypothetical protein